MRRLTESAPDGGESHVRREPRRMEPDTYARPELLAEPDWLESHRDDPAICIVDCSAVHGAKWAYLPGAVPLPVHFSLKDPDDAVHVIPGDRFAEVMGSIGVSNDTTVVAYDRHGGMAAARLWWVLNYYGHTAARLLNGGWHRWLAEGRPISLHPGRRPPVPFHVRRNAQVLATLDYLRAHLGDPDVQILDLRNQSEWEGQNPWGNRYFGHLPGAIHWEWVNTLTADERRMFRSAEELWMALAGVGLHPDKEVITHCQAGIRASHGAFVLSLLGFERVRNYEASMKEWANRDDAALVVEAH